MNTTSALNSTAISKILNILLVFISMLAMSCKLADKIFPQVTDEEASEVKRICDNIKPPFGFAKKNENFSVKSGHVLRSTQYSSAEQPEEIEKYFVNLLSQPGWKFSKDTQGYGKRLFFTKDKIKITIDMSPPNFLSSRGLYSVQCSIGL